MIELSFGRLNPFQKDLKLVLPLKEAVACFQEAISDLRIYPACLIKEKTAIFSSILHAPKVTAVRSVTVKLH